MINSICQIACQAIETEDKFLLSRKANLKRYHHGITFLSQKRWVYFIFREMISQLESRYEVRIDESYPNQNTKADLVIFDTQQESEFWIEARWLDCIGMANDLLSDADKLKQHLAGDVTKLLLALWVKEPRLGDVVKDQLARIQNDPRISAAQKCCFRTSVLDESTQQYIDVEAGVTLFTVR